MSDAVLIETLYQIKQALERIINRFEPVEDVDFFLDSDEGLEKLDGICMQLIAIGESLKHIDKLTNKELLQNLIKLPICRLFEEYLIIVSYREFCNVLHILVTNRLPI